MKDWRKIVRVIPDFPRPGILFRDILPVLADAEAFQSLMEEFSDRAQGFEPHVVVAPEARAFLLAGPLADRLKIGIIAVRKPGKLPGPVLAEDYALEYGESRLEVEGAVNLNGSRALIVDDVLATGGTVTATAHLVERLGAQVSGFLFLMELERLGGRNQLPPKPVEVLWRI